MKNHKSKKTNTPGMKAVPYFGTVQQFAFLNDLPFFLYNDQLKVIGLYQESLKRASGYYERNS
jgi:hypothetical protein